MLENSYIESAFGKMLDDKNRDFICNATQLEFTNRTFVETISSTSPMRGRKYGNTRPDLIILMIINLKMMLELKRREKKWKRYSDDVNSLSKDQ